MKLHYKLVTVACFVLCFLLLSQSLSPTNRGLASKPRGGRDAAVARREARFAKRGSRSATSVLGGLGAGGGSKPTAASWERARIPGTCGNWMDAYARMHREVRLRPRGYHARTHPPRTSA